MERLQKQPLTSPGSVSSSRGSSVPGSPSSIVAKMDNQVLGYKDLAAIPKDKAILDIERPDLMIYEPHFTYSLLEHVELPRSRERSLSPKSTSPPPSPEVWAESRSPGTFPQASAPRTTGTPRTSLPHFHHPETTRPDSNIYKKPPIYKQREPTGGSPQSKHLIEDLIIESSKFPAAQPPDPNQPAKIETDYWPCPPSLAVVETEWRKRKASRRGAEEEEEEEDDDSGEEMKALRERQREELSKVTSNLGKMILKEEMEKSLPIRRKTRSLPDRTPFHTSLQAGTSKSSSLPAYGRTTLSRLQSTDFSPSGSETESPGLQNLDENARRTPMGRCPQGPRGNTGRGSSSQGQGPLGAHTGAPCPLPGRPCAEAGGEGWVRLKQERADAGLEACWAGPVHTPGHSWLGRSGGPRRGVVGVRAELCVQAVPPALQGALVPPGSRGAAGV
uniref:Dematin actin binding protein n=2 Tax=Sus scrofa TaxID=9823 RepID=A0A8D1D5D3_PIG